MNKKQLMAILGISMLIMSVLSLCDAQSANQDQDILNALSEANSRFTYRSKPIHPGLVWEFSSLISDPGIPVTISIDISAAYDTNEYMHDAVEIKDNGYIYLKKDDEDTHFFYKWLGRLDNGLHVLEVGDSGGGSGVFKNLFFVRFTIDKGFTDEGEKYNRLLLSIVRKYPLGDRDDGNIEILKDKVIISKSIYRREPVILKFAD